MAALQCSYYSHAVQRMVQYNAILPTEPKEGSQYQAGPFRTMYLLHGYCGCQNDWLLNTRISEWAARYGWAVIMPGCGNNFYVDIEESDDFYGRLTGEELIEVTRKTFPLSDRREETVIAGLSMGGYGAVRNGLQYADTFGTVVALSSALITDGLSRMKEGEPSPVQKYSYYRHLFGDLAKLPGSGNDPKHLAKALMEAGKPLPRLFLACGTEDFLYENNADFHQYLEGIGYAHAWREKPGAHTWDFWNESLLEALEWMGHPR